MNRLCAAIAMAVSTLACGPETHCDPSYPVVHLEVPGGSQSISSYQLSGACGGGGTPTDCQAFTCAANATCCQISVPITRQTSGFTPSATVCHVEVVSAGGSVFAIDIDTVDRSGECTNWSLVDPSQSTIVVQFPGG